MSKIMGVSKKYYPVEGPGGLPSEDQCCILVVLVAGEADDYAAYIGCGSEGFVMRHGDKVSFAHATAHFPGGQLDESRYRL